MRHVNYTKGKRSRSRGPVKSRTKQKVRRAYHRLRPRHALRKSPFGRANSYPFTRSVTEYLDSWATGDSGRMELNTDQKYYCMQMRVKLTDLPSYDEFRTLFTRYKITSWDTIITPSFKNNIGMFRVQHGNDTDANTKNLQIQPAIPNFEMFIIPATFTVKLTTRKWADLTYDEITDILDQSQIKSRRVIPSKGFRFKTKYPQIVRTGFVPEKMDPSSTDVEQFMAKAPWLINGQGPHQPGAINDQRTVEHYGFDVIVRRVDGEVLTSQQAYNVNANVAKFGWRVTKQVYLKFDKVR